jgi:glyoxylase-like metal-dependent hydrolase (beta-lactamase superfamily II)
MSAARIEPDVAPGVHRVGEARTNWYVIEDAAGLTVVDTGLPRSWGRLGDLLRRLGRAPEEVRAVVLTHAHFDHVGFAERARRDLRVPVYVHPGDARLARHPFRYRHARPRAAYALRPGALPTYAGMLAAGLPRTRGVRETRALRAGEPLAVPGAPVPVHTPGHTDGHCALHLPERGAVIAGDALVTLDPYTGRTGPRLVARAATADPGRARGSLAVLARLTADVLLPGHGEPWTGPPAQAAEIALAEPIA